MIHFLQYYFEKILTKLGLSDYPVHYGKYLTKIAAIQGVYRKWYEMDYFLRQRTLKALRNPPIEIEEMTILDAVFIMTIVAVLLTYLYFNI